MTLDLLTIMTDKVTVKFWVAADAFETERVVYSLQVSWHVIREKNKHTYYWLGRTQTSLNWMGSAKLFTRAETRPVMPIIISITVSTRRDAKKPRNPSTNSLWYLEGDGGREEGLQARPINKNNSSRSWTLRLLLGLLSSWGWAFSMQSPS